MSDLRVLCTLPDRSVAVIVPSPWCVRVLREGGGISCFAHAPQLDLFRYGLQGFIETHPDVTPRLAQEIARTGIMPLWLAKAWEAEKFIRDPAWRADMAPMARRRLAEHWIEKLHLGGLDEADAVALIAAKDAPSHATAIEIVDKSEVPPDRTHRNAWRRSHNGGPIVIDHEAAQAIDETRLWSQYESQNQQGRPRLH